MVNSEKNKVYKIVSTTSTPNFYCRKCRTASNTLYKIYGANVSYCETCVGEDNRANSIATNQNLMPI